MRILVIEDEPQLARHIVAALQRSGHEVDSVLDGLMGLNRVREEMPDLVVLDINLPGLDGFTLLERLRQEKNPSRVIVLTARGELENRIRGLRAGADDYLGKPFAMEELIARVEALGRRTPGRSPEERLVVGDLILDTHQRQVTRAGTALALSPREFELLQVLMQEPARFFSRTELCERVWQREHEYDTRTVEIFITRLRKKVDAGREEGLIQTQRGVGYAIKSPAKDSKE